MKTTNDDRVLVWGIVFEQNSNGTFDAIIAKTKMQVRDQYRKIGHSERLPNSRILRFSVTKK